MPPPVRHTRIDNGFRTHNINVYPERPARAYAAYIDGGIIILDIADKAQGEMIVLDIDPACTGQTSAQAPQSEEAYGSEALSSIPVSCGDRIAPIGPG